MCLFILQVSISDHKHMKRIQAKAGNERKKDQVSVRVFGSQVLAGADAVNIAWLQRSLSKRPEMLTHLRGELITMKNQVL